MRNLPIIALDFKSAEEVNTFLDQFDEELCVKIGMELFYQTDLNLSNLLRREGMIFF